MLLRSWYHPENGHLAFANGRKARAVEDIKDQKIERLEAKLQRKDSVLAELMEERLARILRKLSKMSRRILWHNQRNPR